MRILVILTMMLSLSACGAFVMAEGATIMASEKTIGDHIISWSSNKDCSTYRKQTGRTYCKEDDIQPKSKVHCYRSLGAVTCYDEPENSSRQEVGRNDHNYDENAAVKR